MDRCQRAKEDPGVWRRADLAVECTTRQRMVLDVRTVNLTSPSALKVSSAEAHLDSIKSQKVTKYKDYYGDFSAFVISLSGGVPEDTFTVLKKLAGRAAQASRPRLQWEAPLWVCSMGSCLVYIYEFVFIVGDDQLDGVLPRR